MTRGHNIVAAVCGSAVAVLWLGSGRNGNKSLIRTNQPTDQGTHPLIESFSSKRLKRCRFFILWRFSSLAFLESEMCLVAWLLGKRMCQTFDLDSKWKQ